MRWLLTVCGWALVAVALVALAAPSVVTSYVGGSTSHGYIKGDRYFVGGHGQVNEVSRAAWRTEYWVSRSFPWAVLLPLLAGLGLVFAGKPPGWKPLSDPPRDLLVRESMKGALIVLGCVALGAWLGWTAGGAPWAAQVGGWAGAYLGGGVWLWVFTRRLRQLPTPAPAAPEPVASGPV
jgi:hypothetical protein